MASKAERFAAFAKQRPTDAAVGAMAFLAPSLGESRLVDSTLPDALVRVATDALPFRVSFDRYAGPCKERPPPPLRVGGMTSRTTLRLTLFAPSPGRRVLGTSPEGCAGIGNDPVMATGADPFLAEFPAATGRKKPTIEKDALPDVAKGALFLVVHIGGDRRIRRNPAAGDDYQQEQAYRERSEEDHGRRG